MLIEQGLLPSETITTSIDTFIEDEKNKNEGDDTVSMSPAFYSKC